MEPTSMTYVSVLKNTLIRKHEVLLAFIKVMEDFEKKLNEGNGDMDADSFEDFLSKRDTIIKQINSLDDGFESIYKKVQEEIKSNPVAYKSDIKVMQQYIPKVTELGVKINAIELRNKSRIERLFGMRKNDVKSYKMSQKTVSNYYRNAYSAYESSDIRRIDQKK